MKLDYAKMKEIVDRGPPAQPDLDTNPGPLLLMVARIYDGEGGDDIERLKNAVAAIAHHLDTLSWVEAMRMYKQMEAAVRPNLFVPKC